MSSFGQGRTNQVPAIVNNQETWVTPQNTGGYAYPGTTDGDLVYRKASSVTTLAISCIGDSTTANIPTGGTQAPPAVLQTLLTAQNANGVTVTVTNEGVGSTATKDWLPSGSLLTPALTRAKANGARIVTVALGVNDTYSVNQTTATQYFANMQTICNAIVAAGIVAVPCYPLPMFSTAIPYFSGSPALLATYLPKLDALANGDTIRLGDTSVYRALAQDSSTYLLDNVHPTQTGANLWAQLICTALLPLVNEVTGQTTTARLGIGSTGQVLTVVAGLPAWQNNAAGFTNPMTTAGDLITGGSGGTGQRLAVGSGDQILTVTAGVPTWTNQHYEACAFNGALLFFNNDIVHAIVNKL